MDSGRNAQAPGLSQLLDALRKYDARTGNRPVRDDDLAERYADPELRSDISGQCFVLHTII